MQGNQVFSHAVINISEAVHAAAEAAARRRSREVDWFIPHQANQRILAGVAHRLGIDEDKVISDRRPARQHLGRLDPAGPGPGIADGRIKPGQLLLLEAMGGGLTWGACVAAALAQVSPPSREAFDLTRQSLRARHSSRKGFVRRRGRHEGRDVDAGGPDRGRSRGSGV